MPLRPIPNAAIALLLVLGAAGCGDDEPAAAPPSAPAPDEEAVVESPSPEPIPAPAPETEARPIDPAQQRALREAVRAGRRAANEGDFAAADAHFQRAVGIEPKSSRLRCEAGYVAFRAEQLDRAERQITSALAQMPRPDAAPEPTRRAIAMCLFNAGLVYESRGRVTDARDAWQRSLALRDNDTVRRRLAALDAPAEAEADRPTLTLDPSQTFEQHAEALRDYWCAAGALGFEPGGVERCDRVGITLQAPEGTAGEGFDARLVQLSIMELGLDDQWYLVVRSPTAVHAYDVGATYNPGVMGISSELTVEELSHRSLIGGPPAELVLRTSSYENDEDMGVCERYGSTAAQLVLCGADGGSPRCARVPLRADTYFERYEGCAEDGEPDEAVDQTEGWAADVRFEGRDVVVERASTHTGAPPDGVIGRRAAADVLAADAMTPL